MTTRFSPHILGQKIGGHERAILEQLRDVKPTCALVMDADEFGQGIHEYCDADTIVIQRRFRSDDSTVWNGGDPEEYCRFMTNDYSQRTRQFVQVLNEPAAYGADVARLTAFLKTCGDILHAHGYRAVLGNIGSATVQPSDLETGLWDEYLRYLAAESARPDGHIAGFHEYTFALLPFGAGVFVVDDLRNPVRIQPENWRNVNLDDPTPYPGWWHLLRVEWFQRRAVAIGTGRFKVIMSEFGWDDMPDLAPTGIRQYLTDTYGIPNNDANRPYNGLRGIRTLERVWRAWYPFWTFEEAAYYQLEWCNRNYPSDYLGFCLFTMSYNDEWDLDWGFNTDRLPNLWQRLAFLSVPTPNPEPPPDTEPPPNEWPPLTPEGKAWRFIALLEAAVIAVIVIWSLISYHVPKPINLSIGVQTMQPDPELVNIYEVLRQIPFLGAVFFGLPVIYYLMELWKRILDPQIPMPPQDTVWGKILGFFIKPSPTALFIGLVFLLSASYYLAGTLGEGETFKQVTQFIVDLINAVGQYLLPTLSLQVIGGRFYDHYRAKQTAGFNAVSVKRSK